MAIKIGLIGVSGYGRAHLNNILNLISKGAAELTAAVIINPEQVQDVIKMLEGMGTKIYPSTDAMFAELSGKLDLVCIPTGIAFHEPMTIQALASGANVLVEKPAAGTADAVRRMMDAEAKSDKFVAVGFQHTYAREVQFIKQYLLGKRLGNIRKIICTGIWPRTDQYYARNNWAGKMFAVDGTPIYDSPINNAFAHYLNLELFFAGDAFAKSAHAVSIEGNLYRARKSIETFDTCAVRFNTESGIEIVTILTHTSEVNVDPTIRIECEKGEVYWQVNGTWNIRNANGEVLYAGKVETPHGDMFMDMVRKASGENTFCCPLSVAIEHTSCIEMLSKQLQPVELTESVTRRETDGQLILDNVVEVFAECLRTGKLPAELGVNWK